MSGRAKVQTEMVTFRAPAGTKQELDVRARSEGYKDRSALILDKVGVSQETALSEGTSAESQGIAGASRSAQGVLDGDVTPRPSESAEGKDKLERAHEAMARVQEQVYPEDAEVALAPPSRPLLTHKHAENCPCSICTKSG
jgi:hypothetical protein